MKVRNRKIIRHLSWKSLSANRTRNIVAILAIALTALLFTSLFTIAMSLNEGFQQANFRQAGGYAHGTFKRMTEAQYNALKDDPMIREQGLSRFLGAPQDAPFNKHLTEIRSADENYAKFGYCTPTTGRLPEEGTDEAAMDTSVLELLGVEPKLGQKITLTFNVGASPEKETTQTFTLCGWWEKDEAMPASEIIVPNSRVDEVIAAVGGVTDNMTGTWNMNVMLESGSAHIDADMQQILADHGYQSEDIAADDYIDYGVNWGYTSASMAENNDALTIVFIIVMLLLILFTGYLIIYNVFQISVAGDVRFYGLLKTIGTTPRQIRRMIRQQALVLSAAGIPIGLLLGWLVGKALVPVVVDQLDGIKVVTSVSPWIFVGAALFALATVFISCLRPGRMAGRVSPVEAVRYTEASGRTKGQRRKKHVSLVSMAVANLGRSRGKTVVTILSLALAVVLFQLVVTFVNGFDMDKYVSRSFASDFQIANAGYFQNGDLSEGWPLSEDVITAIEAQGGVTAGGRTYGAGAAVQSFQSEDWLRQIMYGYYGEEELNAMLAERVRDEAGDLATNAQTYGMEGFGLDHLRVVEGDLADVYDPTKKTVAVVVAEDDYGNADMASTSRRVGDVIRMRFVSEWEYVARETGEVYTSLDDIPETVAYTARAKNYHDVMYTVTALVTMPNSFSYGYRNLDSEEIVMNAQNFISDSGNDDIMYYAFNTDDTAVDGMEGFLKDYTETIDPSLGYQSKQTYIDEFNGFRGMFALLGGTLAAIIAVIGVLNVFNAILTGITVRRRELAMLQSIGMTSKQLRGMLVIEGLLYTLGAVVIAAVLTLAVSPLAGEAVSGLFFWFSFRPTYWPLLVAVPAFALIGALIPLAAVRRMQRRSVVERLREE